MVFKALSASVRAVRTGDSTGGSLEELEAEPA